jgi:hypothetical protein
MPPKEDPKKRDPNEKPKKHLEFETEADFDKKVKAVMEETIEAKYMLEKSKEAGKPPAAPAKGKDGAVEKVDPKNQMFNKEGCLAFAEAMKDSWFEEEELKALWDEEKGFPRKDKDGKAQDFVSRLDMIKFYKNRCFDKKWIK